MTPAQARALLSLIADLYQLASTPDPKPEPVEKVFNHIDGTVKERAQPTKAKA